MKAILAHITGGDADAGVLESAHAVARMFDGHVEALHTRLDPSETGFFFGGEALAASVPVLMEAIERDAEELSRRARAHYDQWRTTHALRVVQHPAEEPGVSVSWQETVGMPQRALARAGRLADLIVTSRLTDEPSGQTRAELETLLLETGRPVMLVPQGGRVSTLKRAVVAWNGSIEASRALAFAKPLLASTEDVVVATATERGIEACDPEPVIRYLGFNGIGARSVVIDATGGLGARLLEMAKSSEADFVVMGAYTRSRVRQLIYGSMTRHVLAHADLPVMLAH